MKHNWEYKRLGEVCEFERGVTYTKSDENQEPTSVIILRSNNINLSNSLLNLDDLKYLRNDFELKENKKLKKNSILICMSNGSIEHIGKTAFIDKDSNYGFGGFMGLIKPLNEIPKYIYYVFKSSIFSDFLSSLNRGANIRNLQFSKLEKLHIPFPPMEVQERIVAELDAINEGIKELREQIKDLDKLAQSLFYETFGDPITNPKGWEVKKLDEIIYPKKNIQRASRIINVNQNIIYIDISAIDRHNNKIRNASNLIFGDAPSRAQQVIIKNDVLVSLVRPNLKNIAINKFDNDNVVASSGFCVLRSNQLSDPSYILYSILTKSITEYLCNKINGAAYPAIREEDLRSMPIPVPPLELQVRFGRQIEEIEKMRRELEAQIEDAQTLLNSRMDYWFN